MAAGDWGSAAMWSDSLEVVVPHVQVNQIARRRLIPPDFARGESHRVEMLRFFAEQVRVRVRKEKHAAIENDDTALASHVTR